jgi:hypothetical protein
MLYARLLIVFLVLNLISCKNNDAEVLHNEIMDIHEEVMPQTGEIAYLYLAFRKKVETDSTISSEQKMELLKQADDMEKAEDEMMVWMNAYIPPHKMKSSKNENEILYYLQDQKKIISNIKVHTNASLASGKKWKEMLSINN